jgi:uncharacterized protein (TIGR01777 family)
MRIVITGASGLIGGELRRALGKGDHDVVQLVRHAPRGGGEVRWDPSAHDLDPAVVSGADAVIHLSGAGIADRRWTSAYKKTLLSSRVDSTTTLSAAIAAAVEPPRTLLSASAVGWYGDTGDRVVTESDPSGAGFLADLCRQWEAGTAAASEAGVRVAHLRTGLVCTARGSLLARLKPLFSLGLGGRIGSGRQYWPWVSLQDQVRAILFLLTADEVSGPVNLTGPEPVTNAEFTRALAEVLHRPALLPVPPFALRIAIDGFADEGVLVGQRAVPAVLTAHGFEFRNPTVRSALEWAVAH